MGEATRAGILDELVRSESALDRGDAEHFAEKLFSCEHWRLYPEFREKTAFLDIETTGLGRSGDYVTVVGLHDAGGTRCYVLDAPQDDFIETEGGGGGIRVMDISEFARDVTEYRMLVTFNGAQFDLPFLRREFDGLKLPAAHMDLRFLLRRLGYTGGLKKIEPRFGLRRPDDLRSLDGYDAVRLWKAHLRGDPRALEKLLRYNACDVDNLRTLADAGTAMMEKTLRNERRYAE